MHCGAGYPRKPSYLLGGLGPTYLGEHGRELVLIALCAREPLWPVIR